MQKVFSLMIIFITLFVFMSCGDDEEENVTTPLDGTWKWTNDDSSGTHKSQTISVSNGYLNWRSVFSDSSSVPYDSWGIDGSIEMKDTAGAVTHWTYKIDRLFVVTSDGTETTIPAVPMNDYEAVVVGNTIKGSFKIVDNICYLNMNFKDENGDYPTEDELIYDFIKQ